jgi:hypothetical protein
MDAYQFLGCWGFHFRVLRSRLVHILCAHTPCCRLPICVTCWRLEHKTQERNGQEDSHGSKGLDLYYHEARVTTQN